MRVLTLLAMLHAHAAPMVEIPVESPREARMVIRKLNERGLAASVVRGARHVRVRLERPFESLDVARQVSDDLAMELGHGVMVLDTLGSDERTRAGAVGLVSPDQVMGRAWGDHPYELFEFTRALPEGVVAHRWERDGERTTLSTRSDAQGIVSSVLVVQEGSASLRVDGEEYHVVFTQARRWVNQLSPATLLSGARSVGFGGVWPPSEGCHTGDRVVYCVDTPAPSGVDSVEFRGRHLTAQGAWIPAEILRYEGGQQTDHLLVGNYEQAPIEP